jgi:hypothetical protein
LIYAGTDDGIIQVSENGGESWRKLEVGSIKGIPSTAFVNDIRADLFDENTVYAVLDNHKFGDLKPYVIKSKDTGRSWTSIVGNIPDRTLVWRLVQDHERKELLFAATEFGIYFTLDGGGKWIKLKGGVPTISFRDITIQRRENDLVAASFGRGFYILDDLTPLRKASAELLEQDAVLFPVKDAWLYQPKRVTIAPGHSEYRAENPPYGAIFTYYLKEGLKSAKSARKEKEKELDKQNADIPFPGWDELAKEMAQEEPFLLFTVMDGNDEVVNHVKAPAKKGIHRVNWNLSRSSQRVITSAATSGSGRSSGSRSSSGSGTTSRGYMATPGEYSVTLYSVSKGKVDQLSGPVSFEVKPLQESVLASASGDVINRFREEIEAFQEEMGKISNRLESAKKKIGSMKLACFRLDRDTPELLERVYKIESEIHTLDEKLNGNRAKDKVGEKQLPTPMERMWIASRGLSTSYGPTEMHRECLALGKKELEPIVTRLEQLTGETLPDLEKALTEAGAPWIKDQ